LGPADLQDADDGNTAKTDDGAVLADRANVSLDADPLKPFGFSC
jgi:hypothetical protein